MNFWMIGLWACSELKNVNSLEMCPLFGALISWYLNHSLLVSEPTVNGP